MTPMNLSHPVDLLIRQALVFDGSLNGPHIKDVAVHQGRIVALENAFEGQAKQTIDAMEAGTCA